MKKVEKTTDDYATTTVGKYSQTDKIMKKVEKMVDEYVDYAVKKYGATDTVNRLKKFIVGDNNVITREHNFRAQFEAMGAAYIAKFLEFNPESYVMSKAEPKKEKPKSDISVENYNLFLEACVETLVSYGPEHLKLALDKAIAGNYGGISNGGEKNYRKRLIENIKPESIKSFIKVYLEDKNYAITLQADLTQLFAEDLSYAMQKKGKEL